MLSANAFTNAEQCRYLGTGPAHLRCWSYSLMHLRSGARIVEIGCVPGTDAVALAVLVGPGGAVVGVHEDLRLVAAARERAETSGVAMRVRHVQADLTKLPFEAGYFDSAFSHQHFQHVPNPPVVLAEMVRVTRHGGWLVVFDTDWTSLSIDAADVEIERRLMRWHVRWVAVNGAAGRQLHGLFTRAGLIDVSVATVPLVVTSYQVARQRLRLDASEAAAVAAGVVTEPELARWRMALETADAEGAFFAAMTMMVATGRAV